MPERLEFVVGPAEAGERLDVLVARIAGLSRSAAAKLSVLVDDNAAAKSTRVEEGMRLIVQLPDKPAPPAAEDVPVSVVFEDEYLLVVSKPAGLVVHPAPGHASGTLVNALLARGSGPAGGDFERPGIVHRLDAGTSGLMIVAKSEEVHARLTEMMAAREVERTYLALVEGVPASPSGTIDAPIGRSRKHRKKMAVIAEGRDAVTTYHVLEAHAETALLEVKPQTGRTHQIRVHLAEIGHAVVGDVVYGRDRKLARRLGLDRPFLHAARLAFTHPQTGVRVELEDPLPADLIEALKAAN
jgi:23S rRNA pseudouridine1911/1915/1917 synthase